MKPPTFSVLIHEKGGGERQEQFAGSEISVGRVQGNDIVLPKGNVSKRHARVLYRDGRFIVTDLNSTNGTYVNRRRITQATIVREGDKIYVGDFVLKIVQSGDSGKPFVLSFEGSESAKAFEKIVKRIDTRLNGKKKGKKNKGDKK